MNWSTADILGANMVNVGERILAMTPAQKQEFQRYEAELTRLIGETKTTNALVDKVKEVVK